MRRVPWALLLLLTLCLAVGGCRAQPAPPTRPPQSQLGPLLPRAGGPAASLTAASGAVSLSQVSVKGQPFTQATRIVSQTLKIGADKTVLFQPVPGRINGGDTLFVSFYLRGEQSDQPDSEVTAEFSFGHSKGREPPSLARSLRASQGWRLIQIPFKASDDYPEGTAALRLSLGPEAQTLELAELQLINYGRARATAELPKTKLNYSGRAASATWRAEALERIQSVRRGELEIRVIDERSKPVAGVRVGLKMLEHEFLFGTGVNLERLVAASATNDAYRRELKSWFNAASFREELPGTQARSSTQVSDQRRTIGRALAWLNQNGLRARGQALPPASWSRVPTDPAKARSENAPPAPSLSQQIYQLAQLRRGQVTQWEVTADGTQNGSPARVLGPSQIVRWFEQARRADPDPRLYLGDSLVLHERSTEPHADGLARLAEALIAAGAPLDGLAFQASFGKALNSPMEVWRILERFSRFDRQLVVSDFSLDTSDERLFADYLRDLVILCFSHPQVEGFFLKNFWAGEQPQRAALLRPDFSATLAAKELRKLVFERWWSELSGSTNSVGSYIGRGFRGVYEVVLEKGQQRARRRIVLDRSTKLVTLELN